MCNYPLEKPFKTDEIQNMEKDVVGVVVIVVVVIVVVVVVVVFFCFLCDVNVVNVLNVVLKRCRCTPVLVAPLRRSLHR